MKLFWHIGPHKTGTTSLQTGLNALASSGRASYYYPPTPEFGPGHAALAWQFMGLNGRTRNADVVREQVERGAKAGYEKVVLSSEEFSRTLLLPDSFALFRPVCETVETELVITLRPLRERLIPELQELIKNGQKVNLTSSQEILDAVMGRPGLRPDFLSAAISQSGASAVSVIVVDSETPAKVFDGMATVLDEKLTIPRNPAANASYPWVKTAWLDVLNRAAGKPSKESRAAVDAAYESAAKHLRNLGDIPYPALPKSLEAYAESVWALQVSYLDALRQSGRIRVI